MITEAWAAKFVADYLLSISETADIGLAVFRANDEMKKQQARQQARQKTRQQNVAKVRQTSSTLPKARPWANLI